VITGYRIEGPQEEVKNIQDEINSYCQNPQNFKVDVEIDKSVSQETINQIKQACMKKYGLVDVKITGKS
jgi:patatin-like phospholipase/acyl hydrolase